MKQYTRVLARVNLDAVEYNIEMMKKNIHKNTQMMAVIKMDGYGHGAVQIAKLLEPMDYIWGYAVATLGRGDTDQRCMPEKASTGTGMHFSLISGM